jgi:hypothetical protein
VETIVQFGPQGRLVGILSGAPTSAMNTTLVLLNAGLVPRAGPFRLHVELAQRLAKHGIRTFRFDGPGIGEAPYLGGCDARAATLTALDHLAAYHGCADFAVGGVCSAADLGWSVAVADKRVSAVLMLDGFSFTGPWFHFARITCALRRPAREWPGMLLRMFGRLRTPGGKIAAGDLRDWPDRAEARHQCAELLARGVRLLCVYTGGYGDYFLHPRQLGWTLGVAPRDPRVTFRYWPDADHTFYARPHRDRLLDTVANWLTNDVGHGGVRS